VARSIPRAATRLLKPNLSTFTAKRGSENYYKIRLSKYLFRALLATYRFSRMCKSHIVRK